MAEISIEQSMQLFELQPGKSLDLQINHPIPLRLKLPLIGYDLGNYIILKYPRSANTSEYKDVLIEGNVLIVRYLMEGNKGECFAFRSSIKNITQYPEKFIFIEYPNKIENRQLTSTAKNKHPPACNNHVRGAGHKKGTQISGIIADISTKGCGFTFKTKSANAKVNKRDIFVRLRSPIDGEIQIPARVCNSRNDNGTVNVGIQFIDDEKLVPKLLTELFIDNTMS